MRKKMLIASLMIISLLMASNINVQARSNSINDNEKSIIGEVYSYIEDSITAKQIPNNKNSIYASNAPIWHSSSTLGWFGGSSKSYSTNNSETDPYDIDYISVVCKIYQENSIFDMGSDSAYNSSKASVSMGPYSGLSIIVKREVYGTHIFQHTGYETLIRETHVK